MSSRAERQATAVWLLTEALAETNPAKALEPLKSGVKRLWPHVLHQYDHTMRRVQDSLIGFVQQALTNDETGHLPPEQTLGYLHMLTALVGDQWMQCPAKPPERKRNWRRLTNAIAEFIELSDPTGEVGVEVGCGWADQIKEILGRC